MRRRVPASFAAHLVPGPLVAGAGRQAVAGSARDVCSSLVARRFSLQEQERFGLTAESLLFGWSDGQRDNPRENHPASAPAAHPARHSQPRAACGASVRPLAPVLRHARLPLDPPLLPGAPGGHGFLRPCLDFEVACAPRLAGGVQTRSHMPVERSLLRWPCAAGSRASPALRDHGEPVERSLLRRPCAAGSRASSALRDHGEPVERSLLRWHRC